MDRGAWRGTIVHGVTKELDTTERLPLTLPFKKKTQLTIYLQRPSNTLRTITSTPK